MTLVKLNNAKGNRSLLPGFSDVFDSILNDSFLNDSVSRSPLPAVNTGESAEFYHLEMAAPGLKKDDFKVTVDRNLLTVSCQAKQEEQTEDKWYTKREFTFSSFVRSFNLPELADPNKIDASYENGILKLDISKREEAKSSPRQIELK